MPTDALVYVGEQDLMFWCPGCRCAHMVFLRKTPHSPSVWTWNGSTEKPTLEPSVLVNSKPDSPKDRRCHLFVTNGELRYCGDCDHELAGKTIPMQKF